MCNNFAQLARSILNDPRVFFYLNKCDMIMNYKTLKPYPSKYLTHASNSLSIVMGRWLSKIANIKNIKEQDTREKAGIFLFQHDGKNQTSGQHCWGDNHKIIHFPTTLHYCAFWLGRLTQGWESQLEHKSFSMEYFHALCFGKSSQTRIPWCFVMLPVFTWKILPRLTYKHFESWTEAREWHKQSRSYKTT